MDYTYLYQPPEPFDPLLLKSDGKVLTGISFFSHPNEHVQSRPHPVFQDTITWLDAYFEGHPLETKPAYHLLGATPFRQSVLDIVSQIPYGQTMTYGEVANTLAENKGLTSMSSQAVGNAIGWNPLVLIIPCHRVIGSDGSLKGYNGGLNNKAALLKLEEKHRPNGAFD